MSVWVIEKDSGRNPRSVARDIFVMAGFSAPDDAYGFWENIMAPKTTHLFRRPLRGKIMSAMEYKADPSKHFYDMTGGAQVIHKVSPNSYQMGTLDRTVAGLITQKVLIINVDDYSGDEEGEMVVHTDRLQALPKINAMVNTNLMLDNGYTGAYIYQINREDSKEGLSSVTEEYINKPGMKILVIYSDPTISTIRRTESYIWYIPHESFAISDDSIMSILIDGRNMQMTLAGQNYAKTCLIG